MIKPRVFIILVNYNAYKDTIECVESLRKIDYLNYKIIIVDNASTNDSFEILTRSLKDCIIIKSKKNLGFAGGNNLGLRYALDEGADYIMLLNNDTLVEPNFLSNMLNSFHQDNKIGIVGCKIMYHPQKDIIWYGGGNINWFKFIGEHHGIKELDRGQCDEEKEVDFITGCCLLIKSSVIRRIGFLSEEYFMYFEDVDFCVKVKEAGYKVWYNSKSVIYHKVGLSGGGEESVFSIKWCTRNRLLFMKKYKNRVSKFTYILANIFIYTTRWIRYIQYKMKGKNDKAEAIIEGIKEGMQLIMQR
ncbi:glycosyltransferase family 2 protein [Clostridium sp.]|uniref:glycosyltransferase family 2 protein n=1 Tax=Clostridium sp. TaxID=1506 RepID=UPI00260C21DC|nr:glycosyltransferase family 2 protein [Clostridium sp.]